jgi:hypothetical protein
LRNTYSPFSLIPLPLYGSEGRNDFIFDATVPTNCLSKGKGIKEKGEYVLRKEGKKK